MCVCACVNNRSLRDPWGTAYHLCARQTERFPIRMSVCMCVFASVMADTCCNEVLAMSILSTIPQAVAPMHIKFSICVCDRSRRREVVTKWVFCGVCPQEQRQCAHVYACVWWRIYMGRAARRVTAWTRTNVNANIPISLAEEKITVCCQTGCVWMCLCAVLDGCS